MVAADLFVQVVFGLGAAAGHGVFARLRGRGSRARGRFPCRALSAGGRLRGRFCRSGLRPGRRHYAGGFGGRFRRARYSTLFWDGNGAGTGRLVHFWSGRGLRGARGSGQGLGGAAGCFLRVVLRRLAAAKPGRAVGRVPGGFLPQGLLFRFGLGRFCLCLPHLHLLAQGSAFFGRKTGAAGGDDAVFTLRRGGHRLRGRGGMLGRAGCR